MLVEQERVHGKLQSKNYNVFSPNDKNWSMSVEIKFKSKSSLQGIETKPLTRSVFAALHL